MTTKRSQVVLVQHGLEKIWLGADCVELQGRKMIIEPGLLKVPRSTSKVVKVAVHGCF